MSGQLLEPCSPAGWHLTSRSFKKNNLTFLTSKNLQSQVSFSQKFRTPPLFTSFINLVYIPAMLIAPVFFIPNESFFGFHLKKFMQIILWSLVTPSLNNETKLSAPSLKSKL